MNPAPPHGLGVCSWSLRPSSPEDLAAQVSQTGVRGVQLALDPIREGRWNLDATRTALDRAGIAVLSGMMATRGEDYSSLDSIRRTGGLGPDSTWPDNLAAAHANARIARVLGLSLVTFHAGFIPHDAASTERAALLGRLRDVADAFAEQGVGIGLETGQESADTLLAALRDLKHPQVGVNFDPANMILYAMGDPIDALRRLAPHIVQVHIKDARPTEKPGTWGREVVAGTGAVDWPAFFAALRAASLSCDLVIEREAGPNRIADIVAARRLVEAHLGAAR